MTVFLKKEILEKILHDDDRDRGVQYILEKMQIDIETVNFEDLKRLKASVSSLFTKKKRNFKRQTGKKIDLKLKISNGLILSF